MQYMMLYALGILKSQIINVPVVMQPNDAVDRIVYQKFATLMMSPEEIQPMLSPQIIRIDDRALND